MSKLTISVLTLALASSWASAQLVQQGGKLVGTGAVEAAWQGQSVAVSGDGNTAIVGGHVDDSSIGAAWVFARSGGVWSQQGDKLVGTGGIGAACQGTSVAISADGDTAIVGGPCDSGGAGAAWVFTRSGGVWSQQGGRLVGSGAAGAAYQGGSVAISADGNTAIVGGFRDNDAAGAAWVFTRSGGEWAQEGEKLVGAGSEGAAWQGTSVAISADGKAALVGGPDDHNGLGAAWVFVRSGKVWSQQGSKLVGADAVWAARQGISVAISGDGATALVGGVGDDYYSGATWVFTRRNGVWSQQGDKLVGTGAVAGGTDVEQGASVAISADGNLALVGGPGDHDGAGAAWAFTRAGTIWAQWGTKVLGADAVGDARLGGAVAISADGTTALVGGLFDDSRAGAAWVFVATPCAAPQVVVEPQSQTVQSGRSATLSVTAMGATPLSYQWYQGLAGDTTQPVGTDAGSFTTPPLAASTNYWVRVSNPCGHSDSISTTVAVNVIYTHLRWVPVVAHNPGKNESQWRSDLGLLNTGAVTANVKLTFHGAEGALTEATEVQPGTQSILVDVVAALDGAGQGALEVASDQPLRVTSRTYNQVAPGAICYANGTQGQDEPAVVSGDGLSATHTAQLAGLTEDASYRCNIGLVNTGPSAAEVAVALHDGVGRLLTSYGVNLAPGEWKQETQPFLNKAGQTAMDRGYAKVTVQTGSGVFAFASVIDNVTNDPTTVSMQR